MILDTESTITRTNPNNSVGLIELHKGNFNHDGVIHIAKRRYDEHTNQNEGYPNKTNISTITDEAVKKNLKETTALLFLVADSLSTFHAKAADGRNWYIYGYGLKITVRKKDESKYVVTGFSDDLFEDKRNPEATETINAVIAKYGYTHEFLDLYAHVGAELASLYPNITSQVQEVNK